MAIKLKSRATWDDVRPQVRTALRSAMHDAMDHMLYEANKIVPHDEGILEETGTVMLHPTKIRGIVSYNTPYAVHLHEHPEYNFQRNRQGKWLSHTFNTNRTEVLKWLHQEVRRRIK